MPEGYHHAGRQWCGECIPLPQSRLERRLPNGTRRLRRFTCCRCFRDEAGVDTAPEFDVDGMVWVGTRWIEVAPSRASTAEGGAQDAPQAEAAREPQGAPDFVLDPEYRPW